MSFFDMLCNISHFQMVVQWTLNLTKTIRGVAQLNQHSVSAIAKLQATGLIGIAVSEAVLPRDAFSKLTANEVGEVAKLLSYHGMTLSKMLECQEIVCKLFSTRQFK